MLSTIKKIVLLVTALLTANTYGHAQDLSKSTVNNMRNDTINVLDYKLNIDLTNQANQEMQASCRVLFESKMNNIPGISLDLLALQVDSVKTNNQHLTYSYNDTLLRVSFLNPIDENDIDSVTVYYQGSPVTDPSGLGGFYFLGDNAFNFGVGLTADPHNYGRVWHPCFDNFAARATYDYTITTAPGIHAYANGLKVNETTTTGGDEQSRWVLSTPIPSYLAGFSVSNYTSVNQNYVSPITGSTTPIVLAAEAGDTTNMKNSFTNLNAAMEAFETYYGPYQWEKIGFSLINFSGAAMEHATNIKYPKAIANATLQYENIMAHELAHNWWGNLVTCETSDDIWINEGFATFSEALFSGFVYGSENYFSDLKTMHYDAIQEAHLNDEGFHALSGMPSEYTYGTHTYRKGAITVHNLRSYLGDNKFFDGLQTILSDHAFSNLNATSFENELSNATGENLTSFFDNWILNSGWSAFSIDSFIVENAGSDYEVSVFVRQKLWEAPNLFDDVPMQVTFVDENQVEHSEVMLLSGLTSQATFSIPFVPKMVYLNKDYGILNGVSGENKVIKQTGVQNLPYSYFHLTTNSVSDSALMRIEHHRVAPDDFVNPAVAHQFEISKERYWIIDGIWDENFEADGRVVFNARDVNSGNLDNELMTDHGGVTYHEDSVVLLWRPSVHHEWKEYDDYELQKLGSPTDGFGRINFKNIKKGMYTFGVRVNVANLEELSNNASLFQVFPNPALDNMTVKISDESKADHIKLTNLSGQVLIHEKLLNPEHLIHVNALSSGTYILLLEKNGTTIGYKKVVIQK